MPFSFEMPAHFKCPITGMIMSEPVFYNGYTYEKEDLEQRLKQKNAFINLDAGNLPLNLSLKNEIQSFVVTNKLIFEQELLRATQQQDYLVVKKCLELGIDPNIVDAYGWTALHYAANNGNIEISQLLIAKRADVNACTATINAFNNSLSNLDKLTVFKFADAIIKLMEELRNKYYEKNIVPLDKEIKETEEISNLFYKYCTYNLSEYVHENEDAHKALRRLKEVYGWTWTPSNDVYDREHRKKAIESKREELAENKKRHEAQLTIITQAINLLKRGYAALANKDQLIRQQLSLRVESNHTIYENFSAESLTFRTQIEQAVNSLKEIYETLTKNEHLISLHKLIVPWPTYDSFVTNMYNIPSYNNSPLHVACFFDTLSVIPILLSNNADPDQKNSFGLAPLHICSYRGQKAALELLLANSIDVTSLDNFNNSALHLAAMGVASSEIIDLLLANEILLTDFNRNGLTPEAAAYFSNNFATASFLAKTNSDYKKYMLRIVQGLAANKWFNQEKELADNIQAMSLAQFKSTEANTPPKDNPVDLIEPIKKEPNVKSIIDIRTKNLISIDNIPYSDLIIQEELGSGGFGIVYKGVYQDQIVAVKQLSRQDASDTFLQEFKKEMALMQQLNSPYIVKFIGGCFEKPHYSLVIEFMNSGNLYDFLQTNKGIGWETLYQIGINIGHGMTYLHQKNVIHADLKSFNILLNTTKNNALEVKISDFGLAKIKISSSISTKHIGQKGGSTRWMAPELLTDADAKSTKESDVYSFGMILWELGAKRIPFEEKTEPQVIATLMRGEREKITAETPLSMAQLIKGCWDERSKRPKIAEATNTLIEQQKISCKKT